MADNIKSVDEMKEELKELVEYRKTIIASKIQMEEEIKTFEKTFCKEKRSFRSTDRNLIGWKGKYKDKVSDEQLNDYFVVKEMYFSKVQEVLDEVNRKIWKLRSELGFFY